MKQYTITLLVSAIFLFQLSPPAQADVYSSYSKLAASEEKGEDYIITSYNGPSETAVIAIHGGGIEIGTSTIAKSVAQLSGSDLYTFEGIKNSQNSTLHITSTRFNEPRGEKLVANSTRTLSIHGCSGSSKTTLVGGRDKVLAAKVEAELEKAGFALAKPNSDLDGSSPYNICNQNASGKGVQLELTYAMRQALLDSEKLYDTYVEALAQALE